MGQRREVADGIVELSLTDEFGGGLPEWGPGAHIDLLVTPELTRQYSLCGDPADRQSWKIAVLREQQGRGGSAFVHDHLREGSRLRVRGPRNNFPLVDARRYLFIAGGVGITPIRTMVAAAVASGAEWTLVYGGRSRATMAFSEELEALAADCPGGRVEIRPQDQAGLLDLEMYLSGLEEGTEVYCCGPEPLLTAVEEHCRKSGVGELHAERFRTEDAGPGTTFQVELRRTGRTLTVDSSETILEVLNTAGVPVLWSCREGTCGTCIVPVVEGIPDHRDTVLTKAERDGGREMLPCISRSNSPILVLDL